VQSNTAGNEDLALGSSIDDRFSWRTQLDFHFPTQVTTEQMRELHRCICAAGDLNERLVRRARVALDDTHQRATALKQRGHISPRTRCLFLSGREACVPQREDVFVGHPLQAVATDSILRRLDRLVRVADDGEVAVTRNRNFIRRGDEGTLLARHPSYLSQDSRALEPDRSRSESQTGGAP